MVGDKATDAQLATLAKQVQAIPARLDRPAHRADLDVPPRWWTMVNSPRPRDLAFAVNDGDHSSCCSGGLTRVALPEGLAVEQQSGGAQR